MNQDAEIVGDDATLPLEPAWENRKEIGFFKSIFLTIWGVMFRPSETFSRFKWDGGYWNPIFLCLLGSAVSGFTVLCFNGGLYSLFGGNFGVSVLSATSVELLLGLFLGLFLGLIAVLASLCLFSGVVLGILSVLRVPRLSYQGVFRAVAYTSILIDLLNAIVGLAICVALPKPLWDPIQSMVYILLMIWQGYCLAIGFSKTTSSPIWKPATAVMVAMLLAYGSNEITSVSNPIGRKIWDGFYHGITGNHFPS